MHYEQHKTSCWKHWFSVKDRRIISSLCKMLKILSQNYFWDVDYILIIVTSAETHLQISVLAKIYVCNRNSHLWSYCFRYLKIALTGSLSVINSPSTSKHYIMSSQFPCRCILMSVLGDNLILESQSTPHVRIKPGGIR